MGRRDSSRTPSATLTLAPALLVLASLTISAQVSGHPLAPAVVAIGAALVGVLGGRVVARMMAHRLADRHLAGGAMRSLEPHFEAQASSSGVTSL